MAEQLLSSEQLLAEARSAVQPTSRFRWRGVTKRQLDQVTSRIGSKYREAAHNAGQEETPDQDDSDTLATRLQIAREISARGDHAAAEAQFRDVLADEARILGPDHPDTLATRLQIAREIAARGDHAAAEAQFRDVLADEARILGPDHPDTLATRLQIAREIAARGDHATAEAQFRDVLADEARILGPIHPDTRGAEKVAGHAAPHGSPEGPSATPATESAPSPPGRLRPPPGRLRPLPTHPGSQPQYPVETSSPSAHQPAGTEVSLAEAVEAAHEEGQEFAASVARDAPALWLEAVLARNPRMPSDLEARLLQGSKLPIDFLLHDEVRYALRRGFWDALERSRR